MLRRRQGDTIPHFHFEISKATAQPRSQRHQRYNSTTAAAASWENVEKRKCGVSSTRMHRPGTPAHAACTQYTRVSNVHARTGVVRTRIAVSVAVRTGENLKPMLLPCRSVEQNCWNLSFPLSCEALDSAENDPVSVLASSLDATEPGRGPKLRLVYIQVGPLRAPQPRERVKTGGRSRKGGRCPTKVHLVTN